MSERIGSIGWQPLDSIIEELRRKYSISSRDILRLKKTILKYVEYVQEGWEQVEVGEI